MSKRELVDTEKFIKNVGKLRVSEFEYDYIIDGLNRAKVSEKEIVKPYLEKLSKEISEAYEDDEYDGYDPNALGRFEERVQELIDNLLAEKGTEE